LNRWHLAGIAAGYMAVTGFMLWIAVERASLNEPVTTGIAPASQTGRPLPIESN
jgi:hypothetical protein